MVETTLVEELERIASLVRAGEYLLAEINLAPLARRLLDEVPGITEGANGILVASWLVRAKTSELLAEPGPPEEDASSLPTDREDLERELEIVRGLVARLEERETGKFGRKEAVIESEDDNREPTAVRPVPPSPPDERPAARPSGHALTLDALEQELESAARVLPDIIWYQVEDLREELRRRLEGSGLVDLAEYLVERDRGIAAFLALLELVRQGEARAEQPAIFGPIRLEAARMIPAYRAGHGAGRHA